MEGEDESSSDGQMPSKYVGELYDRVAPLYEKVYLNHSNYYRHLYNELLRIFNEYFDNVKVRSKVLDLGSGTGIWSALLRRRGYHVVSLDISLRSLMRCARTRCAYPIQGDAVKLPFRSNYFDAVLAYGSVFNHILNAEAAFKEVSRVLTRGGYLIFDFDNLICSDMVYEALLGGISIKDLLKGLLDGKGHLGYWYLDGDEAVPFRFFTFKEIKEILGRYGFKVLKVHGIHTISNIIPSRLHQWGKSSISRFAVRLYGFDRLFNRLPIKYVSTTMLIISRKQ